MERKRSLPIQSHVPAGFSDLYGSWHMMGRAGMLSRSVWSSSPFNPSPSSNQIKRRKAVLLPARRVKSDRNKKVGWMKRKTEPTITTKDPRLAANPSTPFFFTLVMTEIEVAGQIGRSH
jgi:hypothetical protein